MKKIIILFLILNSQINYGCSTLEEAGNIALASNKFVLAYFSEGSSFDDNTINNFFLAKDEKSDLLNKYVSIIFFKNGNQNYIKKQLIKYHITILPSIIIIDANGELLYKCSDYKNSALIKNALTEFSTPPSFLYNELTNFNKNKCFNSVTRVAQKYLDFSLLIDERFKENIYFVCQEYLDSSIGLFKRKEQNQSEKRQKLELLRLSCLAYFKHFDLLDKQINPKNSPLIVLDENQQLYYFLKYITAKALKKSDFLEIEEKIKTIDGFDNYTKKADLILAN